jgi:diguanylate cyclase (GGDEF)-like protein/PAS domain S-box-containing protein
MAAGGLSVLLVAAEIYVKLNPSNSVSDSNRTWHFLPMDSTATESFYRALFDAAGDSVVACDEAGRVVECNQAALEMLACPREALIGSSPIDWSPEFQADGRRSDVEIGKGFARVLQGEPIRFDWRYRRRDGTPVDVEATTHMTQIGGRKIAVVVSREISAAVRLERELRLAEEKFAKAFRNSPDPMILSEIESGLIRDVNRGFCDTFGYSEAESIGRTTVDIGLWVSAAEREATVVRMRETGRLLNHEVQFRTKGGDVLTILGSSTHIDVAGKPCWLVHFRDITARKRMEDALRLSEQRFRAMAEMSSDWFWEQDGAGRFTSIIGSSGAKTPLAPDETVGKTRWELFPEALTAEQWTAHRRQLAEREPFELEYRWEGADGEPHWLHVRGAPRYDAEGGFIGYHGTAQDVTARRRVEVEMARQTAVLQATLDHMSQGISVADGKLQMTAFNRRFCEILDFPPEMAHVGASFESFIRFNAARGEYGPCDVEAKVAEIVERSRAMQPHRFRRVRPNGRVVEVAGNPLPDGGFVTTYTDVTEQEHAEQALRRSEQRYRALAEMSPAAVFMLRSRRIVFANQTALALWGAASADQVLGRDILDFIQPDFRDLVAQRIDHLESSAQAAPRVPWVEQQYLRIDGSVVAVEASAARVELDDGPVVLSVIRDITRRKEAEARLNLAASVFTHAQEGIMIADADGNIVDVNETFVSITGYGRDEAMGRNPRMLSSGRHGPEFFAAMWRDLATAGHWYGEIWNRRKNGEIYPEMLNISAVKDAAGRTQHYVALFSDITALKDHQRKLEHVAHYDALTGQPNRVLLADRLQQAIARARRRHNLMAVVYLDLDGFKAINDTHGHETGDELLVAVALRLKETLREGDTLARLGGDEFVVVLADLANVGECESVLSRLLRAAAEPVLVRDIPLQVTASLGVTVFPLDDGDADSLVRHADQAMYQAKQAGKNRYHLFDPGHDREAQSHRETYLRLAEALERREFELHYQPKVNMRSGEVVGVEALIRWRHPKMGLLAPGAFLPMVEDSDLIAHIGDWVLDAALDQMVAWQREGLDIAVSVNTAVRQLQREDFLPGLSRKLAAHPSIAAERLELEVLETAALEDFARVSQVIKGCQDLGLKISLDDFGTGYSSLTYLRRLPATVLKIDQSFIRDMLWNAEDLAIVEGVIGLAAAFHRTVIAEGVETTAHGELLLRLGCDFAQGYGIAHPMPAPELPAWVAQWRPHQTWAGCRSAVADRDELPLIYAEVDHRHWIHSLENYLAGAEAPPALDVHQCRFGIWYDGDGRWRFGQLAEFRAIEAVHLRVHAAAANLVALKNAGKGAEAARKLGELHALRDELVGLLHALSEAMRN